MSEEWLLDDFRDPRRALGTGTGWRCFTDQVMGGVSEAQANSVSLDGRAALRLRGRVSLENNGGFVQVALDLARDGGAVDASAFALVDIEMYADGRPYQLNLRTTDCRLPWQSYRAVIRPDVGWNRLRIPFDDFSAHRLSEALNLRQLRRIGLLAIGEAGAVDVSLARLAFLRQQE